MKPLWGMVVAISHEWKGIRPLFVERSRTNYQGSQFYEGELGSSNVVAVVSGMGPERAGRATQYLLNQYPITHLLSTGYCGGLTPDMKSGEAVIVQRLCSNAIAGNKLMSSSELVEQATGILTQQKIDYHLGCLMTSNTPVFDVEEKKKFAEKFESIAVDMESFSIAQTLSEVKPEIPFLTVRFIFDELTDLLPEAGTVDEVTGDIKPWPLVKSMVKNPGMLKMLPTLGDKAQRARKNLVKFIQGLFEIA